MYTQYIYTIYRKVLVHAGAHLHLLKRLGWHGNILYVPTSPSLREWVGHAQLHILKGGQDAIHSLKDGCYPPPPLREWVGMPTSTFLKEGTSRMPSILLEEEVKMGIHTSTFLKGVGMPS